MIAADQLPRLEDVPIPEDVRPTKGWTQFMVEMADHIGAYATLKLIDHFGGEQIYFPKSPSGRLLEVMGEKITAHLGRIYGGERIQLPVARNVLMRARRASILAAVRANRLTAGDGARILKTPRNYFATLLASNEGTGNEPAPIFPPRRRGDARQIDMFD